MGKNDWIAYGIVILGVVAVLAYGFLIPAGDRTLLTSKFLNPTKFNAIHEACKQKCGPQKTLHCDDACLRAGFGVD